MHDSQVNDPSAHSSLPPPIDRAADAAAASVLARGAGGSAAELGDAQRQLAADVAMAEGGGPAPPSNLTPILAQGQTYSAAQEVRWNRVLQKAFCDMQSW